MMSGTVEEIQYIDPAKVGHKYDMHPSAAIRWMRRGVLLSDGSRVRLRFVRLPGGFRTTQAWLDEFFGVVAADKAGAMKPEAPKSRRSARIVTMEHDLAEAGFTV